MLLLLVGLAPSAGAPGNARCMAIPRGCAGGAQQEWFLDATDALELGAMGGVRGGTGDCPAEYDNSSTTRICQATRQELTDNDPARLARAEARSGFPLSCESALARFA